MIKIIGQLILDIMVYGTPTMLITIHILHFILPNKFDKIWFNRDYFSEAELAIYSSYPLSLVRTLAYSSAICLPFLMKKRFTDLGPAKEIHVFLKFLIYFFLLSTLLVFVAGLASIFVALALD